MKTYESPKIEIIKFEKEISTALDLSSVENVDIDFSKEWFK